MRRELGGDGVVVWKMMNWEAVGTVSRLIVKAVLLYFVWFEVGTATYILLLHIVVGPEIVRLLKWVHGMVKGMETLMDMAVNPDDPVNRKVGEMLKERRTAK